jgi:hypothetical protein
MGFMVMYRDYHWISEGFVMIYRDLGRDLYSYGPKYQL